MPPFPHAEAIEESLALAAERCADLTPLVYERLFARLPHAEPLFVRDTTGAIKGEMLAQALSLVLDYVGERRYAQNMVGCEAVTHSQYDVPVEDFSQFFEVVADTLAALLGPDWTPAFSAAWARLTHELALHARNGAQPAPQVA